MTASLPVGFADELVVDLFAGGGGASLGIARAYREPDVAVNHNPVAIAVHAANHPSTHHFTCDVFEVDPVAATGGRPVGVLWASPDCRHHSKAKGGKPRSKKIRGLAWVVIKWAAACKPRVICLENVEEFADWGPLLQDGKPCPLRKGLTFRRWKRQLENLGYVVEHRELIAADYGAPTIRKRLYVIARCDGRPIVWPQPTHAKRPTGILKPWRAATECIDFALPARSIFDRKKPLALNTQRRIAKGLWRYVLNCAQPFIVPLRGTSTSHTGTHPVAEPLTTISGQGTHHALVTPFLTEHANASTQRVFAAGEPLRTQCAVLIQSGYGERTGQSPRVLDLEAPLGAVVAGGVKHALATAFLEQANGGFYDGDGRDVRDPLSTICASGANQRLVTAYFVKYYGNEREGVSLRDPMHTVTTKDRIGLVECMQVAADTVAPAQRERAKACADFLREHLPEHFAQPACMLLLGDYVLTDITLRMLAPRELARAQGFPDSYVIERGANGQPITKTDQVRLIGNSVCPNVAQAIIAANAAVLIALQVRTA